MKLLAIMGSYRIGKTIDTLIDKAIEGAKAVNSGVESEKLYLIGKNIQYCRNCRACEKDDPDKPMAQCVISDDMQAIYPKIEKADYLIFGTPVNISAVTAVMKTFLERICYVFGKPGNVPLKGCPAPRSQKKKRAIIIVSSGVVPPLLRNWCDGATPLIKDVCKSCLNARVVGSMYAGAVYAKGVEAYLKKAYALGEKLVK